MELKTTIIIYLFFTMATLVAIGIEPSSARDKAADFMAKINTERLSLCEATPDERITTVYVFNLTNPADFLNRSLLFPHIAKFQEIGPFLFKETPSRENCSVNFDNLNINYKNIRELSSTSGNLDGVLNTANIAFNHFARFVYDAEPYPTLKLRDFIRNGEGYLKENGTIRDFLLTGYNISMMDSFLRRYYPLNHTELQKGVLTPFADLVHPQEIVLNSDPETFGEIVTLDGRELNTEGNCTPEPTTEGTFFSVTIKPSTILNFYSEDFCGVIPLRFNTTTTYEGVSAVQFLFADDALEKASCDCRTSSNGRACLPTGAVDVKVCQKNLPYIVSLPHFLNADPTYTKFVEGLSPNRATHTSYFIINPTTGQVLESSIKFQLNFNVTKFPDEYVIWQDIAIQDTVFPLFWVEKKFKMSLSQLVEIRRLEGL